MAKPKKPARRSKILGVPVNPSEEQLFKKVVEQRHTTFAQLVRELLYREAQMEKARKFQAA